MWRVVVAVVVVLFLFQNSEEVRIINIHSNHITGLEI